jgi:hypothetical protein
MQPARTWGEHPVATAVSAASAACRPAQETALFEPFVYKNDHFAKTGSGQT